MFSSLQTLEMHSELSGLVSDAMKAYNDAKPKTLELKEKEGKEEEGKITICIFEHNFWERKGH